MVLMHHVEPRSRLYLLISLSDVPERAIDPTDRKSMITDARIIVGRPFKGVGARPERVRAREDRGYGPVRQWQHRVR